MYINSILLNLILLLVSKKHYFTTQFFLKFLNSRVLNSVPLLTILILTQIIDSQAQAQRQLNTGAKYSCRIIFNDMAVREFVPFESGAESNSDWIKKLKKNQILSYLPNEFLIDSNYVQFIEPINKVDFTFFINRVNLDHGGLFALIENTKILTLQSINLKKNLNAEPERVKNLLNQVITGKMPYSWLVIKTPTDRRVAIYIEAIYQLNAQRNNLVNTFHNLVTRHLMTEEIMMLPFYESLDKYKNHLLEHDELYAQLNIKLPNKNRSNLPLAELIREFEKIKLNMIHWTTQHLNQKDLPEFNNLLYLTDTQFIPKEKVITIQLSKAFLDRWKIKQRGYENVEEFIDSTIFNNTIILDNLLFTKD